MPTIKTAFSDSVIQQVADIAKARGLSHQDVIRVAVEQYLTDEAAQGKLPELAKSIQDRKTRNAIKRRGIEDKRSIFIIQRVYAAINDYRDKCITDKLRVSDLRALLQSFLDEAEACGRGPDVSRIVDAFIAEMTLHEKYRKRFGKTIYWTEEVADRYNEELAYLLRTSGI